MAPPTAPRTSAGSWRDLNSAWTVVTEFVAAVTVYGVLGWFADKWLGTGHVLFLVGLLLGTALGIYVMIKRTDQVVGWSARPATKDALPGTADRAPR